MKQWYVIKTKPKREQDVVQQLSRVGLELFLPLIQGIHLPKPLFPSYLFVSTDLRSAGQHRLLRYTRGVSHILGDQEGPLSIPTYVIEELRSRTRDGKLIEQELLMKTGDSVIVKRGILKDLIGMVEKHLPEQKRVQILFKWWSTSMRVKLKYTDLERAA